MKYKRLDENNLHITLPVKDLFINSAGVIHGGIISSLADVAVSNLLLANEDCIQQVVTVDRNVTFLNPATGTHLAAIAKIEKQGKTLIHTECAIYNDKEENVA